MSKDESDDMPWNQKFSSRQRRNTINHTCKQHYVIKNLQPFPLSVIITTRLGRRVFFLVIVIRQKNNLTKVLKFFPVISYSTTTTTRTKKNMITIPSSSQFQINKNIETKSCYLRSACSCCYLRYVPSSIPFFFLFMLGLLL